MPCPSGVNIPAIFRLYNNISIGGSLEQYKSAYARMMVANQSDASQCTECGECEESCSQNLRVIQLLKDAHAVLAG